MSTTAICSSTRTLPATSACEEVWNVSAQSPPCSRNASPRADRREPLAQLVDLGRHHQRRHRRQRRGDRSAVRRRRATTAAAPPEARARRPGSGRCWSLRPGYGEPGHRAAAGRVTMRGVTQVPARVTTFSHRTAARHGEVRLAGLARDRGGRRHVLGAAARSAVRPALAHPRRSRSPLLATSSSSTRPGSPPRHGARARRASRSPPYDRDEHGIARPADARPDLDPAGAPGGICCSRHCRSG